MNATNPQAEAVKRLKTFANHFRGKGKDDIVTAGEMAITIEGIIDALNATPAGRLTMGDADTAPISHVRKRNWEVH